MNAGTLNSDTSWIVVDGFKVCQLYCAIITWLQCYVLFGTSRLPDLTHTQSAQQYSIKWGKVGNIDN